MGDGESAEGSIWEAMAFSSHYGLDNLVAIFDINRLGQSEPTALGHNMDIYKARCEAFGFHAIVVDGHDVEALCKVFHEAAQVKGKPTAVLLKTFKGKGLAGIEDAENWHGKPLGAKAPEALAALRAQIVNDSVTLKPQAPEDDAPKVDDSSIKLSTPPSYKPGEKVKLFLRCFQETANLSESFPRRAEHRDDSSMKLHIGIYLSSFLANVIFRLPLDSRTAPLSRS